MVSRLHALSQMIFCLLLPVSSLFFSFLSPFFWWQWLELPVLPHAGGEGIMTRCSCVLWPYQGLAPKSTVSWGWVQRLAAAIWDKRGKRRESWHWSLVPESSAGFIRYTWGWYKVWCEPEACPHHMNPGKWWCLGCSLGLAGLLWLPAVPTFPFTEDSNSVSAFISREKVGRGLGEGHWEVLGPLPVIILIYPALIPASWTCSLGLIFNTCTFCSRHKIKEDIPSLCCSQPLHLTLGFSETLSPFSFIEATWLIETLIASVCELDPKSVTGVDLGNHSEPLTALELFWDYESFFHGVAG